VHLKSLMEKKDTIVIPTSAEYELALRKAAKAGLVEYEIGSDSFKITDASKLTNAQAKGLEKVAEFLKAFGCTGVQRCIETAVFDLLDLIPVYPVEDEHKYTDKEGRVLPDVYLMPKGSNARELAYKVHTELGDNFIRAIDARTKRVIGQDHELRKDDVITIVARK
jgi:ribosome-binding ATPase YchF (GTP1/OBG family)